MIVELSIGELQTILGWAQAVSGEWGFHEDELELKGKLMAYASHYRKDHEDGDNHR